MFQKIFFVLTLEIQVGLFFDVLACVATLIFRCFFKAQNMKNQENSVFRKKCKKLEIWKTVVFVKENYSFYRFQCFLCFFVLRIFANSWLNLSNLFKIW